MNKENLNINLDKIKIKELVITEENIGHFVCEYEDECFKIMTEFILYDKHISLRFHIIESENSKFAILIEEPYSSSIENKIKSKHFEDKLQIRLDIQDFVNGIDE